MRLIGGICAYVAVYIDDHAFLVRDAKPFSKSSNKYCCGVKGTWPLECHTREKVERNPDSTLYMS